MFRILASRWIASLLVLVSCSACSSAAGSQDEAVKMARDKVLYLSRELNGHVSIEEKWLLTKDVKPAEGGGWHVTLVQGECAYMVYVNPGHEIDVTGASEGCFRGQSEINQKGH